MNNLLKNDKRIISSPIVYIVMPVYNGEEYLLEQLMSIYYQNYSNWYLLCINDGSTDSSENIIKDFISHYDLHKKVKIIAKENGGVNSAVQRGLEEVKKTCDIHNHNIFISLCDQDDIWTRQKLEIQVKYMINYPKCDLSYHDSVVVDENGILTNISQQKTINHNSLSFFYFGIVGNPIASNRIMFKAKYIDDILPMATGPGICQDERVFLVVSLLGANIDYINKKLTYHRLGHRSLGRVQRDLGGKKHRENKQKMYIFLQERFPEHDLSYIINYNHDRYVKRNRKYGLTSLRTCILILSKYPRAFFLLTKCVLYKVVNKVFG